MPRGSGLKIKRRGGEEEGGGRPVKKAQLETEAGQSSQGGSGLSDGGWSAGRQHNTR